MCTHQEDSSESQDQEPESAQEQQVENNLDEAENQELPEEDYSLGSTDSFKMFRGSNLRKDEHEDK